MTGFSHLSRNSRKTSVRVTRAWFEEEIREMEMEESLVCFRLRECSESFLERLRNLEHGQEDRRPIARVESLVEKVQLRTPHRRRERCKSERALSL